MNALSRRFSGLHIVGGPMVRCHLLTDANGAVVIDTGLTFEGGAVLRRLRHLGLRPEQLRAILLTHGHLDHTANADFLQRATGAPVYLHPADTEHLAGRYGYAGRARACGWLEAAGRRIFSYRPPETVLPLEPGSVLPFWEGLEVVHLPGHTAGHCGFRSRRHDLLFAGDLFASYAHGTGLPPRFLNSCEEKLAETFERLVEMKPRWVVPSHYDRASPEVLKKRFDAALPKIHRQCRERAR